MVIIKILTTDEIEKPNKSKPRKSPRNCSKYNRPRPCMIIHKGNKFSLAKATDGIYPSKKFILLIWLTDNNKEQDETDAGEVFTADVTYRTSEGGRLTASVDGKKSASDSNSSIGV